jgi:hypothetical protein
MFCEGMWWFAFIGLLIGIAMQWKAAYDYAKVYIHKYDEVHRAQKENEENENIESTDDFKAEV